MLRILITGVAGNIGASLSRYLLNTQNNLHIFGIDNFLTGKVENLPISNNFSFYYTDCNQYIEIKNIFELVRPDYVFHYAACAGVERTLAHPEKVFNDFNGIKNIVILAKEYRVKKIAYSSSSEVYGEPMSLPLVVGKSPINPKLPYAGVKALSEIYIENLLSNSNLKFLIFRFFNTYGPYQSDDYVIKKFLQSAIRNEDILIYGSGLQSRTFCFVRDNIEATSKMMFDDAISNTTINIGSPHQVSIIDLAKKIIRFTKSKSRIIFLPSRKRGDADIRQPDSEFFMKYLDRDLINLDEGLNLTLKNSL